MEAKHFFFQGVQIIVLVFYREYMASSTKLEATGSQSPGDTRKKGHDHN